MSRHGHAALALVKLIPLGLGGYLVMRFAFQQAEANGQGTLWLAVAAVVPLVLGVGTWMIKDSGNLRELRGRYDDFRTDTKRELEKNDEANEKIFRDLGAQGEFRRQVDQRLQAMQDAIDLQGKLRHDLRNEIAEKIAENQLSNIASFDKLEERVRAVERTADRRGAT